VTDVVGVFLLTVNRRLPLVGVDTGPFDDADGISAEESSALVDACGDVCRGPLTVGVISCCRISTHTDKMRESLFK